VDIIQSISDWFLSDGLTVTLAHPIIISVSRRMRSSSSLKKFIGSILTPAISKPEKVSPWNVDAEIFDGLGKSSPFQRLASISERSTISVSESASCRAIIHKRLKDMKENTRANVKVRNKLNCDKFFWRMNVKSFKCDTVKSIWNCERRRAGNAIPGWNV